MVLEAMLFELVCSDSVALVHYGLVALVWLTDAASGMMHGGSSPEELAVDHVERQDGRGKISR